MTKSEIIKAAEEVIEHFEYEAKFIEETFDMVDTELVDKHRSRASAIHALIALVPKDGEVVVPEEPTNHMIHAGLKVSGDFCEEGERIMRLEYEAMLRAAKD